MPLVSSTKRDGKTTHLVLFEFADRHLKHLCVGQADAGESQVVAKNLKRIVVAVVSI